MPYFLDWRAALGARPRRVGLAFAALVVFCLAAPRAALADDLCTVSGPTNNILTCSGDQSDGVSATNPPYDTLLVNGLTEPIEPADGVPAISFAGGGGGDLTLKSDAGNVGIFTDVTTAISVTLTGPNTGDVDVETKGLVDAMFGTGLIVTNSADSSSSATAGNLKLVNEGTVSSHGSNAIVVGLGATVSNFSNPNSTTSSTTGNLTVVSRDAFSENTNFGAVLSVTNLALAFQYADGFQAVASTGATDVISTGTVTQLNGRLGITAIVIAAANNNATVGGGALALGGSLTVSANNVTAAASDSAAIQAQTQSEAISNGGSIFASAGDVTVKTTGTISATGFDSMGISASSTALGNGVLQNGDITVEVLSGSVTGGAGTGVGVRITNGATNTLNNAGTISALSNSAVVGGISDDTINNSGVIIGNVDLGIGANNFNNLSAGIYESGDQVLLGAGRSLNNAGIMSPGDRQTSPQPPG